MENLILYFSGTGNARRAVDVVARILASAGQSCRIEVMRKGVATSLARDRAAPWPDRVLVVFPVYAWSPPDFILRILAAIARGDGSGKPTEAAVLAVDGGGGGRAADIARRTLEKRGYRVAVSARAGYTQNWTEIVPLPARETVDSQNAEGDAMAARFAASLLAGSREDYRPGRGSAFAQAIAGPLFRMAGRRFLGKLLYADADCNSCGLCARMCPSGTIELSATKGARPFWNSGCEDCSRCINICPVKAINTSWARLGILAGFSVAASIASFLACYALAATATANAISVGLSIPIRAVAGLAGLAIAQVLVIGPLDRFILKPLGRIPAIDRFLSGTFTKGYIRYRNPDFSPEDSRT